MLFGRLDFLKEADEGWSLEKFWLNIDKKRLIHYNIITPCSGMEVKYCCQAPAADFSQYFWPDVANRADIASGQPIGRQSDDAYSHGVDTSFMLGNNNIIEHISIHAPPRGATGTMMVEA